MARLKYLICGIFLAMSLSFIQTASAAETLEIISTPTETYAIAKRDPILIRIGYSGAEQPVGSGGLVRTLAQDYLQAIKPKYALAWYRNSGLKSLQQLKGGAIDIALICEKPLASQALREGWATNYTPIFNDHFMLIGPKSNPADLSKNDTVLIAFTKIAKLGSDKLGNVFLSLNDSSNANIREKSLWQAAGFRPWENATWYIKSTSFAKNALLQADAESLYSLTDWGSWLTTQASLKHSKVYIMGGEVLVNQCFALLRKKPSKEDLDFLEYLKSPRAQQQVELFGKNLYGGFGLFTPAQKMDF